MPEATSGSDLYIYKEIVNPLALRSCVHSVLSPNAVTTLGIAAGVLLAHNIATGGNLYMALTLAIVVSTLDCLDGSIARKCGKGSEFGAKYDLVADLIKTLLVVGAIGVFYHGVRPGQRSVSQTVVMALSLLYVAFFAYEFYREANGLRTFQGGFAKIVHDNTVLIWLVSILTVKLALGDD